MKNYYFSHHKLYYSNEYIKNADVRICHNKRGWDDCYLGTSLVFSHRKTSYTSSSFPEKLHKHSFYEIILYFDGDISYMIDKHELFAEPYNIIVIPPNITHSDRLVRKTTYDRIVIYFEPSVLQITGITKLPAIFTNKQYCCLRIEPSYFAQASYLISQIFYYLKQENENKNYLCYSHFIQFVDILEHHSINDSSRLVKLPQNVLDLKAYIDENYQDIHNTIQIAEHFFYSREYISRIFKQHFNTNISDYIARKRIDAAKTLLENGNTVTEAYHYSGYRTMSSFIRSFKKFYGCTPSDYQKYS